MNILFELKYTFRKLFNTPGFTALTIAVMTLGLGVSIFILSFVHINLYKPLPYQNSEAMVKIGRIADKKFFNPLLHDFQTISEQNTSFSLVSAFYSSTFVVHDGTQSMRLQGINGSEGFFDYTKVEPLIGRTFTAEDHQEGAQPVMVLSHKLWQDFFAGDANVVGQVITVNRRQMEVIGVMPKNYLFPFSNPLWVPIQTNINKLSIEDSKGVHLVARLKPGISVEQAQVELNTIVSNNPELKTNSKQELEFYVNTYKLFFMHNAANMFYMLLMAGLFVLALCCINVGNLLLARSISRSKEIAVRLALGATKARLIREILLESVVICVAGGILATLLAGFSLEMVEAFFTSRIRNMPIWVELYLSAHHILLIIASVFLAIILTGLIPAFRSTQGNFNDVLKDSSKTSLGRSAGKFSKVLVTLEVALSCTILIVTGVLFVLIGQALNKGYGIDTNNYLVARVSPQNEFYPKEIDLVTYFNQLNQSIKTIPGIKSATLISRSPADNQAHSSGFAPEGQEFPDFKFPTAFFYKVFPKTLDVLGIPVLEGRSFNTHDKFGSQAVAIVSEAFAKQLWPNESAVGKRIRRIDNQSGDAKAWRTVVGVVPEVSHGNLLTSDPQPKLYIPANQSPGGTMDILLKTPDDPHEYIDALRAAAARVDSLTPIYRTYTMNFLVRESDTFFVFIKRIFEIFSVVALIMAATGIYAVTSNQIEKRTQELGIRRALGANKKNIFAMLLKQNVLHLAAGFLVGMPLGWLMSKQFVSILGASSSLYALTYIVVPCVIAAIVFFATIIPGKRALRLQPATALHYE